MPLAGGFLPAEVVSLPALQLGDTPLFVLQVEILQVALLMSVDADAALQQVFAALRTLLRR